MALEKVTKDYMRRWWQYVSTKSVVHKAASASEFLVSLGNLCNCDAWHDPDDD